MRRGNVRVIENRPAVLNDPRNGHEVEDLAVVHYMAIREVHLHASERSQPLKYHHKGKTPHLHVKSQPLEYLHLRYTNRLLDSPPNARMRRRHNESLPLLGRPREIRHVWGIRAKRATDVLCPVKNDQVRRKEGFQSCRCFA